MTVQHTITGSTLRLRIPIAAEHRGKLMSLRATAWHGVPRLVRGWHNVEAPSEAIVIDHEVELNQAVVYTLTIDGQDVFSHTFSVPSATPVISDPRRGHHIAVTILDWPEAISERTGQVLHVDRSSSPVLIDGVELAPTSVITVIHNVDEGSAQRLAEVIAGQSVVRIRPACADLPTVWASIRGRRRRKFSRRPDSVAVDVLELHHIDQPDQELRAIGSTLGDLHAAVPTTLADINARWATLGDLAFEDLST